jgi:RNA polymerase sigma factor (sigma-70 family)
MKLPAQFSDPANDRRRMVGSAVMNARTFELAGLYTSQRKRLHRLIYHIVGNRAVAEDVAQDAFVKLNDRALGPTDHGLLFRTAQNLALDHLRAQRVRDAHARTALPEQHIQDQPLPDHVIDARQRLHSLLAALKALPPRTQQIFLLNRLDGLSQVQIAKVLGLSVSTVEKETIRALAFCRAWQKEHDKA